MAFILFAFVFLIFFNPNSGLKKYTLRITNSYRTKQPRLVNAANKMNFNSVGIPNGKIKNEPKYKKII